MVSTNCSINKKTKENYPLSFPDGIFVVSYWGYSVQTWTLNIFHYETEMFILTMLIVINLDNNYLAWSRKTWFCFSEKEKITSGFPSLLLRSEILSTRQYRSLLCITVWSKDPNYKLIIRRFPYQPIGKNKIHGRQRFSFKTEVLKKKKLAWSLSLSTLTPSHSPSVWALLLNLKTLDKKLCFVIEGGSKFKTCRYAC